MNLLSRSGFCRRCFCCGANLWGAGPWFNIVDYGARNDGSASATAAIRSASRQLKRGRRHQCMSRRQVCHRPIELVSNLVLEIDAGRAAVPGLPRRVTYTRGGWRAPSASHQCP